MAKITNSIVAGGASVVGSPTRRFGISLWLSFGVLGLWFAAATIGPILVGHSNNAIISETSFADIGEVGLLGTDYLGRDLLSRMIFGARTTLLLSLLSCSLAFMLAVPLGFAAAAAGGWGDMIGSRVNDAFLAFPSLMLALICITALGSSMPVLIATVAFIEACRIFRVARGLGVNVFAADFIDVARLRGERLSWIMLHEILPNTFAPLATDFGLRFTYCILLVSSLSFLGLGIQPPSADLGMMVRENLGGLAFGAPAVFLPAGAIFCITISVNFIVDWHLSRSHRDISSEMVR